MANKMRAGIYHGPQDIRVEEIDVPSVGPRQILIDTKVSGICGSDLHVYNGDWTRPAAKVATGHELSGVVVEVGEGVSDVALGDRVCAECFHHCGYCTYCKTGQYNLCDNIMFQSRVGHGGFAEYSLLPTSAIFRLPDRLSFEEGALVEPLAVSYRAVSKTQAGHGDSLAILGAGTIGLLCVGAARAKGVREITITAKYDHQAKAAEKLGADHVVLVGNQEIREEARSICGGLGFDVVVDTLALDQTCEDALAIARKGGVICLVGGYTKPLTVQLRPMVDKELRVLGSLCYGYSGVRTDFGASIESITSGKVDASSVVTHRFPLEDLAKAFRVAADKSSRSIKVHICQ